MKHFSRLLFFLLLGSVIFLTQASRSYAMTMKSGEDVSIGSSEVINGTLFLFGETVTLDADVDGDVICAGNTVRIRGEVMGDVICGAQNITIDGNVDGSIRAAGQNVTINGTVGRNITAAGQNVVVGPESVVGEETTIWGNSVSIDGQTMAGVFGGAKTFIVNGKLDNGLYVTADKLTISEGALVSGEVKYTSKNDAMIQGSVTGPVVREEPKVKDHEEKRQRQSPNWINKAIRGIVFNLVVGVVLVLLFPKFLQASIRMLSTDVGVHALWGVIATFVVPMLLVLISLTIIGIPVALLGALAWFVVTLLGKFLVTMTVGARLTQYTEKRSLFIPVVVGVIVMQLGFHLPYIGWLIALAAMAVGVGGLLRLRFAAR